MKKVILFTILLIGSQMSQAQHEKGQKVASLKLGFSVTGLLINSLGNGNLNTDDSANTTIGSISTSKIPAISATFDYGITDKFSLGGIASTQNFSGNVTDFQSVIGADTTFIQQVDFKLNRIYLGIVPKFHWNGKNETVDPYSAIRVGYIIWANDISTSKNEFDILDGFAGGRPAVALVPIGTNIYFSENFGANLEIAIGAPYLFSAGASYKF